MAEGDACLSAYQQLKPERHGVNEARKTTSQSFERWLNVRGYIGAVTKHSFGLFGQLYSVNSG